MNDGGTGAAGRPDAAPAAAVGAFDAAAVRFDERGLVPAVVQDIADGAVLMLGWMDREAVEATLATGSVHFHSRSRGVLWRKGETSGNTLDLVSLASDCDRDALLVTAKPSGPTCHTGARSCFGPGPGVAGAREELSLAPLFEVLRSRAERRPPGSYTVELLDDHDRALKKIVEEAGEIVLAAKNRDHDNLVWEVADLLYHVAVVMVANGVEPAEVDREL
ncbi:MAG: bifunctional phosphoribosyl-AMP cyclohydrolase/phosphoribosyl-ATP diphosphatase HisIE, partial [Acidobacteriota bacterium]